MGAATGMNSFDTALYYADFVTLTTGPSGIPPYQPTVPPYNTHLSITNNSAVWKELGDVISLNGVPMERSVTPLTHLRSPGMAAEKIPGFLDAGQLTLRLNSNKGLLAKLQTLMPAGDPNIAPYTHPKWGRLSWAVFFPDNGIWLLTGFIKSSPVEIPEDNRITIELTVEISGKPTFLAFV
ncbi:hypothetical protein GobsT_23280 [Gemmata obscuriglobus]|uniref:Phage tail protein n=1 Tax=Gemmata obscuriglobus TaxID=114 RepID=A0A2Z3H6W3_9BACT|nr:phage tail tube protein [Gemmata obscuriglobus]AWM39357.1 hypothetical protein C1280_21795 [Gemmata obscuriglobus]QEG27572.1 hypothetical protein GobsT_23280 [Gemmata obscuriglobus]VTS04665.1 unnamed protein product [Gemmata obscuriglobus UQM 2246]